MSAPIIAWNNLLSDTDTTYVVNNGTEIGGKPISNAWNLDMLNPAIVEADAGGVVAFTLTLSATAGHMVAFGAGPYNSSAFGRQPMQALIVGASRHESGGFRSIPSTIAVDVNAVNVLTVSDVWVNNTSVIHKFASVGGTTVKITLSGFAASELVVIPELFLGPTLEMPHLDLGYDSYNEEAHGTMFVSESGRGYPNLRYRLLHLKPKWSVVEEILWNGVDELREFTIEEMNPLWFAWNPELQDEVYLMRHNSKSAPFNYAHRTIKSFGLDLGEAL